MKPTHPFRPLFRRSCDRCQLSFLLTNGRTSISETADLVDGLILWRHKLPPVMSSVFMKSAPTRLGVRMPPQGRRPQQPGASPLIPCHDTALPRHDTVQCSAVHDTALPRHDTALPRHDTVRGGPAASRHDGAILILCRQARCKPLCSAVQCSTVQCSAVQCDSIHCMSTHSNSPHTIVHTIGQTIAAC
jgi:hypothetical protein